MDVTFHNPTLRRTGLAVLAFFGITGVALLAAGPADYPNLHAILDTMVALLSGALTLLLWDMGTHVGRPFPKWLAASFAVTFGLELIHVLVTVEWAGPIAPIAKARDFLRPATWPPSVYLLPQGIFGALWLLRRGTIAVAPYAMAVAVVGGGLFIVFQDLPTYLAPGPLTALLPSPLSFIRPVLSLPPLLWVAVAAMAWRLRDADRLIRPLVWMAGTLALGNLFMFFSRAPEDGPAMVVHLGAISGRLILFLSVMQMASRDMAARMLAEARLARMNEDLDRQVLERTAALETANTALQEEMKARRESQRLLEAVIETTPAIIYVKDLVGRYLMVNRRFGDVFHVDPTGMIGKTDYDVFSKDAADRFRAMDERVAEARRTLTEEEAAPHDDGLHTYISVKSPLQDDTGKSYAVFGISTDITERKVAEAKLQTQLERLGLLDQITRAIGQRQDIQSIFQVVVRSVEDQLPADFVCLCLYDGLDRALTVAAVGVNSQALALELAMPERARIDIDQNGLSHCVQGHLVYEADIATVDFPFPRRLAQGRLRSLVAAPLLVESKVFGILIVARLAPRGFVSGECEFLRQLSEHAALALHQAQLYGALQVAYNDLRQSQQAIMQQERLRALGQLASGIAHDINNALSPVALYTESMLETESSLSPTARSYLEIIQRAVEDVTQTIARMKEFYRQREPQLTLTAVDPNEIVRQVLDLTRARWSDMAMQRGTVIDVRTHFARDLPAITGVESEIREALINLVLNAVDALPDGGVLTLRTAKRSPGNGNGQGMVDVEVEDNGAGMDAETRRRCLEPFFTTKGERGTGLGLAMVYGVVQRHGAEIDVRSAPGEGTTVRLSFPLAGSAAGATRRGDGPVPPTRLRLLLVDDDPVLLRALRDALETDGHLVTVANDGQAGIDAFREAHKRGQEFAAVITDLGMPYVDGRSVAAEVKGMSPSTPVILLTGWGQGLIADADIPPHVDQVLGKPPKLREIRESLARHCRPSAHQSQH